MIRGMRNRVGGSTADNKDPSSPARRKLLQAGALLIALVSTSVRMAFSREDTAPPLGQSLRQLARHLFPHDQLPDAQYEHIASSLVSRASTDSKLAGILKAGVALLDEEGSPPWLMRDEAQQLTAIKRIEGSDFFRLMRTTCIEHLYRNEDVWHMLGYQGSSIEFGGYVGRGFDDIDWLPAESEAQ